MAMPMQMVEVYVKVHGWGYHGFGASEISWKNCRTHSPGLGKNIPNEGVS